MTETFVLGIIQTIGVVTTGALGWYMKYRVKKSDALVVDKIENVHSVVKEVRKEQKKRGNKDVCVLVLDDNANDLKAIQRIIERTGIKYTLYSEVDPYLANMPYDANVHIIDHFLFLHKMSGLDVLREIREKNPDNFVIAYTGAKDENTVIEYFHAGVNKFVNKNHTDHLNQLEKYLNEGIKWLC